MEENKKSIFNFIIYFIVILIVISAAILVLPVYQQFKLHQAKVARLREETALKTAECIRLHEEINALKTSPRAIEKVAREKFGMCRKGELIIKYPPLKSTSRVSGE